MGHESLVSLMRTCQDVAVWCARTATFIPAGPSRATTPSTPAVARPALRWVTCRTLTSVLRHDRSIIFCRLLTWPVTIPP
jgi:hypothetical protein